MRTGKRKRVSPALTIELLTVSAAPVLNEDVLERSLECMCLRMGGISSYDENGVCNTGFRCCM